MIIDKFLQTASDWFINIKAPDLKEKVLAGLQAIEKDEPLEGNYKKLFGFILFDYCMHIGPITFLDSEEVAEKIGVIEELKYFANDWINYSKNNKTTA